MLKMIGLFHLNTHLNIKTAIITDNDSNYEKSITTKYSEYLAESIKYLIAKYQEENEEIKSVAVIGEKTSLMDNSVLKNLLHGYDLHIFENIS